MGCFTAEPNGTPKRIIASLFNKFSIRGPFGPGNNFPYECRGSRYAKAPDARDLPLPKRTRPDREPRDLSSSDKSRPHKYPEPECSDRVGPPLGCSAVGGEPEGTSGDHRNDVTHINYAGNPVGHTSIPTTTFDPGNAWNAWKSGSAPGAFKREGKSTLKSNSNSNDGGPGANSRSGSENHDPERWHGSEHGQFDSDEYISVYKYSDERPDDEFPSDEYVFDNEFESDDYFADDEFEPEGYLSDYEYSDGCLMSLIRTMTLPTTRLSQTRRRGAGR